MPRRKAIPYYQRDRRRSLTYSLVLHGILLILAITGLPSFLMPKPPEEPMAITVDILPLSAMSNVKPSQKQPEENKPKPKETPPVKTAEDQTPPPSTEPSILPKPKPDKPKPPEPKKPKPKAKSQSDDFAALMNKLANEHKNDQKKTADNNDSKSKSNSYNENLPMSLSEMDSIRNQIAKCWNVPAGARNAHELVVVLRLQLAPDGSVLKVDLASDSESRYASDSFFRAAADSARRAVQECSPIKNLPQDKYATWRDIEMTFNPKDMLF